MTLHSIRTFTFTVSTGLIAVACLPPGADAGSLRPILPSAVRANGTQALPPELLFIPTETGTIDIYRLKEPSKPIAQITGLKNFQDQMVVDAGGNLFVTNNGAFGVDDYVSEYAPPYNSAPVILSTAWKGKTFFPIGIAVDAGGTLYVSNCGTYCGEKPRIFEYPPGATSPSQAVTSAQFDSLAGLAADAGGNIYIANWNVTTFAADVFKLTPGSTNPKPLGLRGLLGTYGTGVSLDASGDMYVSSFVTSSYILEFKPGKRESFRVIDLASWFQQGPLIIDVGPDDNLYAPVVCTAPPCRDVYVFGPSGNKPLERVGVQGSIGEIASVATYPNLALRGSLRSRTRSARRTLP
ncbi:MAG: hypothetical protein ABI346_00850 [Candidatus Baltobacteraceae bacterium]